MLSKGLTMPRLPNARNHTPWRLCLGCLTWCLLITTIHGDDVPTAPADKTVWRTLWDGKTLQSWKITEFGGEGAVEIRDGMIVMQQGSELTGIHWSGPPLPTRNYEIELEAQRLEGSDFFCGLIFPVGDSFCSFVVGGWGGSVVGLSAVDGLYAIDNETVSFHSFDDKKWYKVRLRVSERFVQAWLNDKRVVRLDTQGRKLTLHPAVDLSKPLGICCFSTVAAFRNIRFRELTPAETREIPPADEE
ncbi:MAG: hypothetical protein KatS3mg114_1238 [Planctomycetaceae bacterium]|nr:MAG: hypothetical protein KatS3mg114_1238 [Planctomycetaceae bacterium]